MVSSSEADGRRESQPAVTLRHDAGAEPVKRKPTAAGTLGAGEPIAYLFG
jgi:hypothetical protein